MLNVVGWLCLLCLYSLLSFTYVSFTQYSGILARGNPYIKYWAPWVGGGKSLIMKSFHQIFSCSLFIIPVFAGLEIVTSLSFYKVDQFSLLFQSASENCSFAVVIFFKSFFHPFYLHLMRICCYLLGTDFTYSLPHIISLLLWCCLSFYWGSIAGFWAGE